MADLYLIAHCVRGEAAFDVATKMQCPHCTGRDLSDAHGCFDCEEKGFWWIIPTSGHRAWPYWTTDLDGLLEYAGTYPSEMPLGWPDHFKSLPAPKVDITSLFRAAQPQPRIARRL